MSLRSAIEQCELEITELTTKLAKAEAELGRIRTMPRVQTLMERDAALAREAILREALEDIAAAKDSDVFGRVARAALEKAKP